MQELKIQSKIKKLIANRSSLIACFRASRESGVTLLELLVAVSMFAAIISVVVAVFLSLVSAQRRSANTIDIDNSAYFALETMAKEIRTGSDFSFPSFSEAGVNCVWANITSNCPAIKFINYRNQIVIYRLNDAFTYTPIEKLCVEDADSDGVIDNGEIYCYTTNQVTGASYTFNPITPSTMRITDLRFNMFGQNNGGIPDNAQARITISLKAETLSGTPAASQRSIGLQTTISTRSPDS